jgi:hypothetical protein
LRLSLWSVSPTGVTGTRGWALVSHPRYHKVIRSFERRDPGVTHSGGENGTYRLRGVEKRDLYSKEHDISSSGVRGVRRGGL